MFVTIVAFILILGLLIFAHEFGHFIMAKRAGIKVEEFGFGFPPRLFGVKKGETVYSINLLPLGGFVKIFGEDGKNEDLPADEKGAFYSKPVGTRAGILAAGVAMNLLLAMVLLAVGYGIGLPMAIEDNEAGVLKNPQVQVAEVAFESPAAVAGVNVGDAIKKIAFNNEIIEIDKVEEIVNFINSHKGKEITLVIQRGEETIEKKVLARENHPAEEGPLGVTLVRTAVVSYPWYQAAFMGASGAVSLTGAVGAALGKILWQLATTGKLAPALGGGPVFIFSMTGQAAKLGFVYLLQFTALLSINLAIINIFPFPALDGGRLVFLLLEKIKGAPVNQKIEQISHTVGFAILMLLVIAITWRDIIRLF